MESSVLTTGMELTARATFVRWEKLRILYNAILAVEFLVGLWWLDALSVVSAPGFFLYVVTRCLGANVCFTIGPVAEVYAIWFFGFRVRLTAPLFVFGTLLASAITLYSTFWYSIFGTMATFD